MISDFSNSVIEMNIGERKFKFRQLSLLELYDDFAKVIISDYIQSSSLMAKTIEDKEERAAFQINSMQNVPSGLKMELKVAEMEITMIGKVAQLYAAMKQDNEITLEELSYFISSTDNIQSDIESIMTYIRNEHNAEEPEEENPNQIKLSAEKKT